MDWPRNGAILKGYAFDANGTPWLEVKECKHVGSDAFTQVANDMWMGFDGGMFNGGKWLHEE